MPPAGLSLEQLHQLASSGEPPERYVLELLVTMTDSQEETRAWASDVLQSVEVLPLHLADNVAARCLDPHPAVAAWACTLLGKLESRANEYQSHIVDCLNTHPSLSTRQQAALALNSIAKFESDSEKSGPLESATVEALRHAAESDDPRLKRLAADALATHAKLSS